MNKEKNYSYEVFYYDDEHRKHITFSTSLNELNFIQNRFGKENVQVTNDKTRQRVISA